MRGHQGRYKPDQIGDALKQATSSNKPTVLEIMATQELGDPFRRDALKKPKRLLKKYEAYTGGVRFNPRPLSREKVVARAAANAAG